MKWQNAYASALHHVALIVEKFRPQRFDETMMPVIRTELASGVNLESSTLKVNLEIQQRRLKQRTLTNED